jgi:hypothetical protein
MSSAREPDSRPDGETPVIPVEPAEWVKPVELIELLQRRTAKRKDIQAPTSSPFYDAEFVASQRKRKKKRRDSGD